MDNWYKPTREGCPNKSGEFVCHDGGLWALTYSECAPPDQRQYDGPCSYCAASLQRFVNQPAALEE
jgi:hypothetical protein